MNNTAFKRIEDIKEPISTIIDANRVAADSDTLEEIPEPELPAISSITDAEWEALEKGRNSKYEKYDEMKVGEVVKNLPARVANTVVTRLRNKGFDIQTRKIADGVLAIRRIA